MKNYVSFFDWSEHRVVYVPRDENDEYSALILRYSESTVNLVSRRNISFAGIMGFIFLQEAMLVLVIVLFLFLFLSTDKKLARRIHLILPFIVYEDMSAIEVTQFLKEHPQFSYSGHKAVSINRGDYETEKAEYEAGKNTKESINKVPSMIQEVKKKTTVNNTLPSKERQEKTRNSTHKKPKEEGQFGSSEKKSIFDDYESVMDKFDKK